MSDSQTLVELNFKSAVQHAAGAAVLGTAALSTYHHINQPDHSPTTTHEKVGQQTAGEKERTLYRGQDEPRMTFKQHVSKVEQRSAELTKAVTSNFDIDTHKAASIVKLALRYEQPTFPRAEDILSIISIESSFKPHAVSNLKHDPAVGLMQVRPKVWGIDPHELSGDIEKQVKAGSEILSSYYKKLHDIEDAVQAYNVGITNFVSKERLNPRYVEKFKQAKQAFKP